jgi:hypothetical protein
MDRPNVLVLILAVIGGVLVSDLGGFRSRPTRQKAERDASLKGLAGAWVDAEAGADVLFRRYNRAAIAFGWFSILCAAGVFLTQVG